MLYLHFYAEEQRSIKMNYTATQLQDVELEPSLAQILGGIFEGSRNVFNSVRFLRRIRKINQK